jgi:hypothetical protein
MWTPKAAGPLSATSRLPAASWPFRLKARISAARMGTLQICVATSLAAAASIVRQRMAKIPPPAPTSTHGRRYEPSKHYMLEPGPKAREALDRSTEPAEA